MNSHEIFDHVLNGLENEGAVYNQHLILLHEWNESNSFFPLTEVHVRTMQGVMVTGVIQESLREFDEAGQFKGLKETGVVQFLAIYGDDDTLMRFTVFPNDKPPQTLVGLEGGAIRSRGASTP